MNNIVTVFSFVNIKESLCLDVANKASVFLEYDFNDELEEESNSAVEVVLYLGLSSKYTHSYLPGRCF